MVRVSVLFLSGDIDYSVVIQTYAIVCLKASNFIFPSFSFLPPLPPVPKGVSGNTKWAKNAILSVGKIYYLINVP